MMCSLCAVLHAGLEFENVPLSLLQQAWRWRTLPLRCHSSRSRICWILQYSRVYVSCWQLSKWYCRSFFTLAGLWCGSSCWLQLALSLSISACLFFYMPTAFLWVENKELQQAEKWLKSDVSNWRYRFRIRTLKVSVRSPSHNF